MKRTAILFLIIILILTACVTAPAQEEHIPETVYTGELNPVTEVPDAGLRGVSVVGPEELIATVAEPSVTFSVRFTGVSRDGAPEDGRLCTVKLIQDGTVLQTIEDFHLTDGATAEFTVDYEFARYTTLETPHLVVELDYGEEYCYTVIPVTLVDYPDEYYAMTSRDPFPYAITIITNKNVAIVYGKDEAGEYTCPVKTFICSTGISTPTGGTYKLLQKYDWKLLLHDLWGQYATWVTGSILIHSVPYLSQDKSNLWSWQYNRLGGSVSAGCIRMRVCDCKWIFDCCPCGTPVTFTVLRELPEGITYPTYPELDLDSPNAGWDPTDPDPENPWKPELPDDSWKAEVPDYETLHEAFTQMTSSEYERFAKTSELFTQPEE